MTKVLRVVPPLPTTERGTYTKFSFDASGDRVLYCNSNNVLWRNIAPLIEGKGGEKPDDVFVYKTHARKTTCVAISPNSQWVASGDSTGAIRLWGAKGDHVLKNEYKLWDGEIKDVSWSGDSTRIFACGDGKETRAVAMIWDTGSKTGDMTGHTKMVNSISFRSQRPFKCLTGSEDMMVNFYAGPPFKFVKSESCHTNFVNWVGFSPDGEWAASAGSDSKLVLMGGKEGEIIKEFEKPAGITGTLWSAAWSPDSNRIVTAGGDKKLRIWDRESGKQVGEAQIGTAALEDMQVGVCWSKATTVVSVCLDGRLLCWEVGDDGVPALKTTVDGTQGALTALACDAKSSTLVTGGSDGTVAILAPDQAMKTVRVGKTIQYVVCHSAGDLGPGEAWVVSLDNCVRRVALALGEFVGAPVEVKENAKGAGWLDASETKLLIGSSKGNIHCVSDKAVEWSKGDLVKRAPTAFACHPGTKAAFAIDKPDIVVGGVQSSQYDIHLFSIAGATSPDGIVEEARLEGHQAEVSCMRFSPTGEFLASGDAQKTIKIWIMAEAAKGAGSGGYSAGSAPAAPSAQMAFEFNLHNARITSLAWMPSGRQLVSGSLDQNILVWDVDVDAKTVKIKEALKKDIKATSCGSAHRGGVGAVVSCGDNQFASVGADGFLLTHEIA